MSAESVQGPLANQIFATCYRSLAWVLGLADFVWGFLVTPFAFLSQGNAVHVCVLHSAARSAQLLA